MKQIIEDVAKKRLKGLKITVVDRRRVKSCQSHLTDLKIVKKAIERLDEGFAESFQNNYSLQPPTYGGYANKTSFYFVNNFKTTQ